MLKGINPLLSPELLKILSEMGHGDEIIIADGNFPGASLARNLVRADGIGGVEMLDAVLSVFPLDKTDTKNFILMATGENDPTPTIWAEYEEVLKKHEPDAHMEQIERFAYYERAKKAYAVIATGEMAVFANILLKKGCVG
ncbi:MAG: L-fucose mutarotase [Clostridia bacterium]|nr:L-fucose mutarotase [Clostridia bacterium]